ncbi:malonyl CoA-acyl carrier protein transacylase [Corallococcus coralloides]|uniref:Malonyl CoA-acyl carrier protein transacylase n=1 Tax=Corallococcus coralloides TaxID=184914 RepID=A0A410RSI5_CORCK|nr:SDR family NAD(P)-dependent oxidoreductase [Corallococcus coralloides]QAT84884.1 malonyl CoA-acyl carrier protein transacylase [Corallococcus coralloides]
MTALWMFTGQGSLVPAAAKGLYEANPVFKETLDRYAAFLESKVEVPLLKLLLSDDKDMAAQVQETQYAQPAIVALQLAQAAMWQARGMRPSAVLGHSVGEFAAAAVAGVMSAEQALELAALRGRLMSECPRGGMAAVRSPADLVRPLLPAELVVAAENERTTTVVAGPKDALHRFVTEVLGVAHTMLAVSHAFHSPMMAPAAESFRKQLEGVELREPQGVRFISTLTGAVEASRLRTAEYWAEQLLSPVLFLRAVEAAWAQGPAKTVVELGPGSTLLKLAQRIVGEAGPQWVASSQALRWGRGPGLFRHVPLGWARPGAKPGAAKAEPVEQATPATCVYETAWTPVPPIETRPGGSGAHLLLTRRTVEGELPAGWQAVVVEDEAQAQAALSDQRWATVALWGRGAEEDVALGLRVLQSAQADRRVFVTEAGSEDDAGLWGLARTFRLERPDLQVRCIEHAGSTLAKLLTLATSDDAEDELSVDGAGVVRVPRLRRTSDIGTAERLQVRPDVTYVISGGQGALGKVVARLLVERGATHVLLLSRTAGATLAPEMEALRAKARVESVACDVSRTQSVREAKAWLEASGWPTVGGVVHAAGVLSDGTLPNQSVEKLRQAYGAKVHGARNLREVFTPSDFLVLFSSAAAVFGSSGQGSYAAANTTLDALARKWSSAGEPVLSVQWGAWSDGGMAARNDAARRAETGGFGSISDALGSDVLEQLLAAGKRGAVCVSPIDWSRLRLELPLLSRLRPKGRGSPAQPGTEPAPSATLVAAEDLLAMVRQAAAESVGRPVADDASLLDSGLDSLGSVSLRNRLASRLNVELSAAFVFEYPSISTMARHLASLAPRAAVAARPVASAPRPQLPVLVIGAGMGGLSFARQLEKAGTSVVVMDAAPHVGGVWRTLANASSKLQIDSPAYDFDSTTMPSPGGHSWRTSFPSQQEILTGCQEMAGSLLGPVYLESRVQAVRKVADAEYEVTYQRAGRTQRMRVSGVAAMTGGLHRPRQHTFPGEDAFQGHIGLGISNDTPLASFQGASVVIVGHGAFAVENMRTALENGARHVTLLCRQQHMVLSTFCNWLLNSSKGVMPVSDVVSVMRPFYAACGVDVESLDCLARDATGEWTMDQSTVPAGSDLYFLAQRMGRLRIVVGETDHLTADAVVTQAGETLKADVFLKCLGSHTDDSVLLGLFGEGSRVQGLWINGDPNLITYNDGAQVPRRVRSLMCASYAFFVQAFAPAYVHFRDDRDAHARALARLTSASSTSTDAERVLLELWDFIEPAKRVLSERTLELLPFERFQVEREAEWERYSRMLGGTGEEGRELWALLGPALSLVHRRNPRAPVEQRSRHPQLGDLSVFVPRRPRVLFLPGQGTNARLARILLERTGWIDRSHLDFVVPDAPYEMPAFTNALQLEQVGLSQLVSTGLYDKGARYREWRAGFEALYARHHHGTAFEVTPELREQWALTLGYLREVVRRYGPFDGIAGFCEGAAVASVALHLQARGEDQGLGSVRFFVAMSPWRSPLHQEEGLFCPDRPLSLPMLQIVGENDMDVFLGAAPHFYSDYARATEFRHAGQHVYPPFTPGLEVQLRQLVDSGAEGWDRRTAP